MEGNSDYMEIYFAAVDGKSGAKEAGHHKEGDKGGASASLGHDVAFSPRACLDFKYNNTMAKVQYRVKTTL